MNQLAEGLINIYFRLLIYPGLATLAAMSSLLTLLLIRPSGHTVELKGTSWQGAGLWVAIALAASILPVPSSIPTFIAGDALFSLLLVHLAATRISPNDSLLQAVSAWTVALSMGALATLSNFLWQDWIRLATGGWYQASVAVMAGLSFLLWAVMLVAGAFPQVTALPGAPGSLARMSLAALTWYSAAVALLVALPPMDIELFLVIAFTLSAGILLLARTVGSQPKLKKAVMAAGPVVSTLAFGLAVFSVKLVAGG